MKKPSGKTIHLTVTTVSRVLLALVFIFSGFVKAVDPMGTAFKIQDYCTAFQWNFLYDYAKFLSFILFSFEMVLGEVLLFGISRRKAPWAATVFLTLMTALTLYLAIADPIQDCGCFGDAIILTNWQTFWKNIILLTLSMIVCLSKSEMYKVYSGRAARWAMVICILIPFSIGAHSLRHLPIFDFRPYRIGNYLPELMTIPEDAPRDSIVMEYYFAKDGVEKSFTAKNIPTGDTAWHYVRREQRIVRKGYVPPIHDFVVLHPTMGDITEDILQDSSYTFLWVSRRLEIANQRPGPYLKDLEAYTSQYGYHLFVLTASEDDRIQEWIYEYDLTTPFCSVDETTLKTMIRANPGLMLLKRGTVINKWSASEIETVVNNLHEPLEDSSIGSIPFNKGLPLPIQTLLLLLGVLLFIYVLYRLTLLKKKLHNKQTVNKQTS